MDQKKNDFFAQEQNDQNSHSPQTNDEWRDAFSNYFSEDELKLLFRENTPSKMRQQAAAVEDAPPVPKRTSRVSAPDKQDLTSVRPTPPEPRHKDDAPQKRHWGIILCVCLVIVALAIGGVLVAALSASADPYDSRILANTTVAGVDVSGMTKKQATKAVTAAIGDSYQHTDMVIQFPDTTLRFSPADTGIDLDLQAAIQTAYDFGRTGDVAQQQADYLQSLETGLDVDLLPHMSLNEAVIRAALDDYAAGYTGKYIPSGYRLEGEMPALSETEYDPEAPCQTLFLTNGTPGFGFDMDEVFQQVLDAYNHNVFLVDLSDGVVYGEPEALDLEKVYDQLYIAPTEPQFDKATQQVTPGSYGYTFNFETAQTLLSDAAPGQTVQLSMECIAPRLVGDAVYFQDTLSFCPTPHTNNEKRTTNLRLACAALDGVVIQPGETISYNEILGQRTAENGYQPAPAYSGTQLVDSLGGGICQVSSTLYMASLFAELEIVDRVNHGFPVSYTPPGLDATVSWGSPDLKIRNNFTLPVQIRAEVSDGFVKIKIMGTELRDYTVRIGFNASGRYARSYICKYASDGTLISKGDPIISSYMSGDLSAYGEIGSGQAYIYGNVKTPEFPSENTTP